jgi:hypothetical protein
VRLVEFWQYSPVRTDASGSSPAGEVRPDVGKACGSVRWSNPPSQLDLEARQLGILRDTALTPTLTNLLLDQAKLHR